MSHNAKNALFFIGMMSMLLYYGFIGFLTVQGWVNFPLNMAFILVPLPIFMFVLLFLAEHS